MNAKQVVSAFVGMIFKVVISIIVIMVVYRVAITAYTFGYDVFQDLPVDIESQARTVNVTIMEGKSNAEIGEILQKAGLIKNDKVFYVQLLLSDYKDSIKPGIYELNTSMNSEEIMQAIAPGSEEGTEDTDSDS